MYHPNELETFDIGVAFERHPLYKVGDRVELPFRFSTDISSAQARLRCVFKHMRDTDEIALQVNGKSVKPQNILTQTIQSDSIPDYEIRIWEGMVTMLPLKTGANNLVIELIKRETVKETAIEVGEFEIIVEPF